MKLKCEAISFSLAGADDATPKWQKLFPVGRFYRWDMPEEGVLFDKAFFESMVANWEKSGRPDLPFNYFHHGPSDVMAPIENKIAAGWMTDLQVRDDGLWALTKWTDKARKHILAGELAKVSPEFSIDADDQKTGGKQGPTLWGAALLNDPFLVELPRVAASGSGLPTPQPQEAPKAKGKQMDKLICSVLGLAEDANVEAAVKAIEALKADAATKGSEVTKLSANVTTGEEKYKLAQTELKTAREELAALKDSVAKAEVSAFVSELEAKGAIRANEKDTVTKVYLTMGKQTATEIYAGRKVVPLGEVGISGKADDDTKDAKTARAKYTAAVEAKAKEKGITFTQAAPLVNAEQPELAKLAFTVSH